MYTGRRERASGNRKNNDGSLNHFVQRALALHDARSSRTHFVEVVVEPVLPAAAARFGIMASEFDVNQQNQEFTGA